MHWLCWVRKDITEAAMNAQRVDLKKVKEVNARGRMQRPVERENAKYFVYATVTCNATRLKPFHVAS